MRENPPACPRDYRRAGSGRPPNSWLEQTLAALARFSRRTVETITANSTPKKAAILTAVSINKEMPFSG
jgi:hypothetical protein